MASLGGLGQPQLFNYFENVTSSIVAIALKLPVLTLSTVLSDKTSCGSSTVVVVLSCSLSRTFSEFIS